jgi:hypothetical protein
VPESAIPALRAAAEAAVRELFAPAIHFTPAERGVR